MTEQLVPYWCVVLLSIVPAAADATATTATLYLLTVAAASHQVRVFFSSSFLSRLVCGLYPEFERSPQIDSDNSSG